MQKNNFCMRHVDGNLRIHAGINTELITSGTCVDGNLTVIYEQYVYQL